MENASKALIMAAMILLGIMILSIGVYLFSTYSQYSSNAYAQMEAAQINQFNAQFLKYYGKTNRVYKDEYGKEKTVTEPILCTVHDIITLANLAKQNNIEQEVDNLVGYDLNTSYIQIEISMNININGNPPKKHLEKWTDVQKLQFIQKYSIHNVQIKDEEGNIIQNSQTKYYVCEEEPIVSNVTKRICYMKFKEYVP